MTTAGVLPFIQAPADGSDTLTIVIIRNVGISNCTGEKHTVITAYQPTLAQ